MTKKKKNFRPQAGNITHIQISKGYQLPRDNLKKSKECIVLEIMHCACKKKFKKKVQEILFAIFHAEDTYVEAPTLLLKMTKYVK